MIDQPPISFQLIRSEEFHVIRPLWEQLNLQHSGYPTPFASEIAARSFEARLRTLCAKETDGCLRIEIALARPREPPVAYCVTSLSSDGVGEVDSLFVAPVYRRMGIASTLTRRALDWLRDSGALRQRVVVLHANDEAVGFYRRFGFHPRNIEFELLLNPK